MPNKKDTTHASLLQDLHHGMIDLPIRFRARVCMECNWSIPTFYRKMRPKVKDALGKEQVFPLLSNAEKEKIMAVSDEVNRSFWEFCEKYRKKNGSN